MSGLQTDFWLSKMMVDKPRWKQRIGNFSFIFFSVGKQMYCKLRCEVIKKKTNCMAMEDMEESRMLQHQQQNKIPPK